MIFEKEVKPSPRSQVSFGNAATVRRTAPATFLPLSHKKLRHPERSEANDLLSPRGLTRAQSKDLVDFPCDSRRGTELLHAGPPRRHGMEMPFRTADRTATSPRSFDSGSAKRPGKTPALLASAQDDGFLKHAVLIVPQKKTVNSVKKSR